MGSEHRIIQPKVGEYSGTKHVIFFGVRLPAYVPFDKNFESDLPQYKTRADDVWITSFPKSGTTWISEIVWQIYNNGATSDTRLNKRVPFLEGNKLLSTDSLPSLESRPSPRLTHSHLPYHVIPKGKSEETQCKYIYIARNPKDIAVSCFHFMKSFGKDVCGFQGSFEFLTKIFARGEVEYGFWHEHVLGWWKHRNDQNVLFLKYEDLKKDLEIEVRKIILFLGKDLGEETIKTIVKQCSFKGMVEKRSNYWVNVEGGPSLIRKGEVGGWKEYFTPEMNKEYEEKVLSNLKGTGLKFEFN